MNFQLLQRQIAKIKEIAAMGRNAEIDGVIYHVMGMVLREDHTLEMLILEYNEAERERIEAAEIAMLTGSAEEFTEESVTNRVEQRGHRTVSSVLPIHDVNKVSIGDLELTAGGSRGSLCGGLQWDKAALFVQFLLNDWNPSGIDTKEIAAMYLTNLEFEGTYDAIPTFEKEVPIRFSMNPGHTSQLAELPVTLRVGVEYPDMLYFADKEGGERHWAQINRVTLYDMWAEMEKNFDDPRMKEQFTPEELVEHKAEFEEHFSEICPKGKCYVVVEYECEEDISLQFYSKAWLEAEPVQSGSASSIGFIMSPDEPAGKLGLKLKAAIIPEPVAPDTNSIEAELFRYTQTGKAYDIMIDSD